MNLNGSWRHAQAAHILGPQAGPLDNQLLLAQLHPIQSGNGLATQGKMTYEH